MLKSEHYENDSVPWKARLKKKELLMQLFTSWDMPNPLSLVAIRAQKYLQIIRHKFQSLTNRSEQCLSYKNLTDGTNSEKNYQGPGNINIHVSVDSIMFI